MIKNYETLATILSNHPCPQCGTVQVLRDDPDAPAATCDCGRKEGAQTRWELGDIAYAMTPAEMAIYQASE